MGFLLAILLASTSFGEQQSTRFAARRTIDCLATAFDAERLICRDPDLSSRDEVLAILLADRGSDEAEVAAQQEWVAQDRDTCPNADCLGNAYNLRIREVLGEMRKSERYISETAPGELVMSTLEDG